MYQDFFGLNELPFELTANPRFLFLTEGHREALSNLEYGLSTAKSMTLLIGEAGTGKTTLLKAALASNRCCRVRCLYVHNPTLTPAEFLEAVARQCVLPADAVKSKTKLLVELESALLDRRAAGESDALVVDEAQSLSHDLLEEIRLLANIETADGKLLPLVLAGQPELAARLNEPGLRQLKQRIALRCRIEPFTLSETAAYISTRIRIAGGEAIKLFTRDAVVQVHEHSRGVPRTINVLCDNALLTGMAVGLKPVPRSLVLEVCQEFDLSRAKHVPDEGPAGDDDAGDGQYAEPVYAERSLPAPAPAVATSSPRSHDGRTSGHAVSGFTLFGALRR